MRQKQQRTEPFAKCTGRILNLINGLKTSEMLVKNRFQGMFGLVRLAVKIKVKDRVWPPASRIGTFQLLDLQALKQILFSFPISLQSRKQQTLSESSRTAQKVGNIQVNKLIDQIGFVDI